jgi:hypothetical protein
MSDLKLVPDAPTPFEKRLLDASRAEQPSSEHKERLRAALGLGLPLPLGGSPDLTAKAATASAPTAVGTLPTAGKSFVGAKVAAAASVAALVLLGALFFSGQPSAQKAPVTSVAPSPVVVAPVPQEPVVHAPEAPAALPPPLPVPSAARAVTRASRGPAAPPASADLSEQIRLIEAARAGVAARNGKSALAALDSYAAQFPRGAFGQESLVLRVRALDQSGSSAAATALARSFIARYPQSPHVARLKPIAERGASR